MSMLGYGGEAPGYTATARALHWTTAALVIVMIPIGIVMANFSFGPAGDVLYDIHRSIGAVLIPLVLVRLAYRLTNPPPPLPDDIPAIQRLAANLTHWALYILLDRARLYRMDRDVGLPRADQGVLAVRAAADLAGGSALFGKDVRRAPVARDRAGFVDLHAYRRGACFIISSARTMF